MEGRDPGSLRDSNRPRPGSVSAGYAVGIASTGSASRRWPTPHRDRVVGSNVQRKLQLGAAKVNRVSQATLDLAEVVGDCRAMYLQCCSSGLRVLRMGEIALERSQKSPVARSSPKQAL